MTRKPDRIHTTVGLLFALAGLVAPVLAQKALVAEYVVRAADTTTPKLYISARIPIEGAIIQMDRTRPGDIPEILKDGWPALIRNLRVTGPGGQTLETTSKGPSGWELARPIKGTVSLTYEVDYTLPARNNWPAPRETGFRDDSNFVFVGRSAFITTPQVEVGNVRFVLPQNWKAVVPWAGTGGAAFTVRNKNELTENLIVLTRSAGPRISMKGFNLAITPMGHWRPLQAEIAAVLRQIVPQFVSMFSTSGTENYSVVLLPVNDSGGESYRGSFAYSLEETPSIVNRSVWARTIAHEVFHYWNGWRLRGADYARTQWFQEGFTDYAADIALTASGVLSRDDLRRRLSDHVLNYRKLTMPLGEPGDRKGPPLYSGGALVAFCWDVVIRSKTSGRKGLPDVFGSLWQQTNGGSRSYEWNDIRTALDTTVSFEWEDFYQRHIRSQENLPLDSVLSQIGLRIERQADGSERIETDPNATSKAVALWTALTGGQR